MLDSLQSLGTLWWESKLFESVFLGGVISNLTSSAGWLAGEKSWKRISSLTRNDLKALLENHDLMRVLRIAQCRSMQAVCVRCLERNHGQVLEILKAPVSRSLLDRFTDPDIRCVLWWLKYFETEADRALSMTADELDAELLAYRDDIPALQRAGVEIGAYEDPIALRMRVTDLWCKSLQNIHLRDLEQFPLTSLEHAFISVGLQVGRIAPLPNQLKLAIEEEWFDFLRVAFRELLKSDDHEKARNGFQNDALARLVSYGPPPTLAQIEEVLQEKDALWDQRWRDTLDLLEEIAANVDELLKLSRNILSAVQESQKAILGAIQQSQESSIAYFEKRILELIDKNFAEPEFLPEIFPSQLPASAEELVGREEYLQRLNAAWANAQTNIVAIVAWAGVGKTSLVAWWMGELASQSWGGARRQFEWSFHNQGNSVRTGGSSDLCIAEALKFFGDADPTEGSPGEKGARLARLVGREKSLVVLDGLETLQDRFGKLQDEAMEALLKGLARQNQGLCIVTSRESIDDLRSYRASSAPEWHLDGLSDTAGAALLSSFQVQGPTEELEAASREVLGHALTLVILGNYLYVAHGGDIQRRDRVKFKQADSRVQGGSAFKVLRTYEEWLRAGDAECARRLALLRLMGLFDRAVVPGCLHALLAEPAIPGLMEALSDLDEEDWNIAIAALEKDRLLQRIAWEGKTIVGYAEQTARLNLGRHVLDEPDVCEVPSSYPFTFSIEIHPLIRSYFSTQLRHEQPEAWKIAHQRVYDHLIKSVPYWPEGLEGLQPLYQAVAHGCAAGLHDEVLGRIYLDRIQRGPDSYGIKRLGARNDDLGALSCFYDHQWDKIAKNLNRASQGMVLYETAFRLRAAGRLEEARQPLLSSLEVAKEQQDWLAAAKRAGYLTELYATTGNLSQALQAAHSAVKWADESGELDIRSFCYSLLGYVTELSKGADGRTLALAAFEQAEDFQKERNPLRDMLYSVRGYRYCQILLGPLERFLAKQLHTLGEAPLNSRERAEYLAISQEVALRAGQTLEWDRSDLGPLACALDHLILSKTLLLDAILEGAGLPLPDEVAQPIKEHLDECNARLRAADQRDYIPAGLLARALFRALQGEQEKAASDLDAVLEIARRGGMQLYLADVHLYKARMLHDKNELIGAQKLIAQCGYGRRAGELEDAVRESLAWQ